jgi:DNA invertase Pin-like site-specific DNA recombinase
MTVRPLNDESVTGSPESLVNVKSGASSPSATIETSSRRAVGVVRVSRTGEDAVSPTEQRERIASTCDRDELTLLEVFEELDVSGGAPLAQRPGLGRAVHMVEDGSADVVVVAYFDRLVRSLAVQAEVVDRVERAGGAILAVDVGQVTNGSAGQWLSGTMLGAVSEYHRRVTAERTKDAKRRAVADGRPPFPNVPPGLRQRADGRLEPHPTKARVIADAFQLRAAGATVMEVRKYLRKHGIERSYHGIQAMLRSRMYLGELRFGELVNPNAHPAIVDQAVWQKVQRMRSPRGRRPKSERLLARLGVLHCGTCGSRMVVGTTRQGRKLHDFYRCPPVGDCPRRVTISSDVVEQVVREAVYERTDAIREDASLEAEVTEAERRADVELEKLNAMIMAFSGLEDVAAAQEKLTAQRARADRAAEHAEQLRLALPPTRTAGARDLNDVELRNLIRALRTRATVSPGGRGASRISVEFLSE